MRERWKEWSGVTLKGNVRIQDNPKEIENVTPRLINIHLAAMQKGSKIGNKNKRKNGPKIFRTWTNVEKLAKGVIVGIMLQFSGWKPKPHWIKKAPGRQQRPVPCRKGQGGIRLLARKGVPKLIRNVKKEK